MKKCPFRAHIERVSAASAATGVLAPAGGLPSAEDGAGASEYRLLLVALGEDLRQLHNIQSIERKIEAKRGMIDRYRDWLDGALSAENPAEDEIVTTMLVWSIDIAEWPLALDLARHALAYGLPLPERYRRSPGTMIAEEFAEAGLAPSPIVDLATLQQVDAMTELADMPDEVRAKLKKAIGLAFKARAEAFDPEAESDMAGGKGALIGAAIAHLERALALDSRCGVKKLIEQLGREAKKIGQENAE